MADHPGSTDYCQETSTGEPREECDGSDCSLREFFCVEGSSDEFYNDIPCPSGCKGGVCLGAEMNEYGFAVEEDSGSDSDTGDEGLQCDGCFLKESCYPFSMRRNGEYCSVEEKEFVSQFEEGGICDNNFECQSNLCIDGECISGGLIKKVLEWFRNFFG